ncbi:MAG: carbohydrate porin [Symploca sp. SIO1C4]|uniref:Carbohydrate porin n=1 Tax=Symploca sp. SIO1C4 TaxID=2607765 RepID=A0A6B3NAP7_9CYAN|nr:carbohydrate porin [Symploca sp. SIO1C4]NET03658.1 carbohydrate porin [Symploca sp. SIO2B6]
MLSLIATTILTQGQIANQQLPNLQLAQGRVSKISAPLIPQSIGNITPVHELKTQSQWQPTTQENRPLCAVTVQVSKLCHRLKVLESRTAELKAQQFSPTGTFSGEVLLGISSAWGRDLDDSPVFQGSIELEFNFSFTGEDSLEVAIESGNAVDFSFVEEITLEGRLGFTESTEDNRFEISEFSYEFPLGEQIEVFISLSGDDLNDFNRFFEDGESGPISEFGGENSIHSLVEDAGIELKYEFNDTLTFGVGYYSEKAEKPEPGAGLFNGNFSVFAQVEFQPSDNFLLGFTYIYNNNDSALETDTGSLRSQINLERPVVGNSYGITTSFVPNSGVVIGGWVGFTEAEVIDLGEAYIWNYAFTLTLPDFGQEGNLLGFVIGQEPRLTGTSGFLIDGRQNDPDVSLHLEAFYIYQVNDHISITPGLIWITAPNHDNSNPDILVLTVRTTLEF